MVDEVADLGVVLKREEPMRDPAWKSQCNAYILAQFHGRPVEVCRGFNTKVDEHIEKPSTDGADDLSFRKEATLEVHTSESVRLKVA